MSTQALSSSHSSTSKHASSCNTNASARPLLHALRGTRSARAHLAFQSMAGGKPSHTAAPHLQHQNTNSDQRQPVRHCLSFCMCSVTQHTDFMRMIAASMRVSSIDTSSPQTARPYHIASRMSTTNAVRPVMTCTATQHQQIAM